MLYRLRQLHNQLIIYSICGLEINRHNLWRTVQRPGFDADADSGIGDDVIRPRLVGQLRERMITGLDLLVRISRNVPQVLVADRRPHVVRHIRLDRQRDDRLCVQFVGDCHLTRLDALCRCDI